MKFSRGIVTGGFRFLINFIEGTRVRSLLLGQACKRAEDTRLSQDTHIGGIDMLIGREKHAIVVQPLVGEIGHGADTEQIGRLKQAERVLSREPFARRNLLGYRLQQRIVSANSHTRYSRYLRTARETLWPPKPKELESATSTSRSTFVFAAQSRSHSGSGSS